MHVPDAIGGRGRRRLVVVLSAWLAACAGPVGGGEWSLARMDGRPPLPGVRVHLRMQDGGVRGSNGCNSFSATLAGSGERGVLRGYETTLVACGDAAGEQARKVAEVLADSPRYEVKDDRLLLWSSRGNLVFVRGSRAAGRP